jgi:hypothetical protein
MPAGEKADCGDAPFTGRALSRGWFILFINECDHPFVQPKTLASRSKTGDVIHIDAAERTAATSSPQDRSHPAPQ